MIPASTIFRHQRLGPMQGELALRIEIDARARIWRFEDLLDHVQRQMNSGTIRAPDVRLLVFSGIDLAKNINEALALSEFFVCYQHYFSVFELSTWIAPEKFKHTKQSIILNLNTIAADERFVRMNPTIWGKNPYCICIEGGLDILQAAWYKYPVVRKSILYLVGADKETERTARRWGIGWNK
jgi:hypothetical protein